MKASFFIVWLSIAPCLFGRQPAASFPSELDRLLATGRVWNTVRFFHPYLAYRDIDWEQSLLSVLPRIRQASNPEAYQSALQDLLGPLNDPATRVVDSARAELEEAGNAYAATPPRAVRSWMHENFALSYFLQKQTNIADIATLPMGAGLAVQIRLSEDLTPDLPPVPRSNTQVPKQDLALAFPSTEGRILAGFKLWGIARQFFAYRDLMDEDWDQTFSELLPKLIAAKSSSEYHLAVADGVTHLNDANSSASSSVLDEYFGNAAPALRIQLVGKKPVVTHIYDPSVQSAGVHVGDLVTAVDGENLVERIKREANYLSFSTPQSLSTSVSTRVLNGADGSTAVLQVSKASGESKEVRLPRSTSAARETHHERDGEPVRMLPGQIGYIDLNRLTTGEIDNAFSKLETAKAIIFDGRGPTSVDPVALAGRLTEQNNVAGCIVTGPLWLSPDEGNSSTVTHTASRFEVRRVAHSNGTNVFRGKTVLLIDGRTSGNSELAGVYMQAANNTAWIGTASAGAVSDVRSTLLPGNISFTWSQSDYQFANGGKLQRLGLQPSLLVPSTVEDVRNGKDGVLTKAVDFVLQSGTSQNL